MPLNIAVLRHLAFEDLGTFGPVLAEAGHRITLLECGMDDLSPAAEADLTIVLGGPVGAYETDRYPWLAAEIELVRDRLLRRRPTLGLCLGAQIMAAALGARVHPGAMGKEIGFAPITLTAEGEQSPLRHLSPSRGMPLHWHGDTFDLPDGAVLLAASGRYPHQAFALGRHALGLQFHPEADFQRLEQWLIGHAGELHAAGIDPALLRRDALVHGPVLARQGALMLREWLAGLRP